MATDGPLSLKKQRILLAIRTGDETDSRGRPQADFSQLREWTGISRGSMQYQFGTLEEDGFIEVTRRDPNEMDTEREPPKLAILPDEVVDAIDTGGLTRDAFFESVAETADPRTFSDIFERMDAVEELVDSYRRDSITHYKKASAAGTDARKRAVDVAERMDGVMETLNTVKRATQSLKDSMNNYTERLDKVEASVSQAATDVESLTAYVQNLVENMNVRFRNVAASVDDCDARLTRVEEYLEENGGKMRAPGFEREEPIQK
jgi:hypothetical protein